MRKYSWVEELSRKRVWSLGVCLMLGLAVLSAPAVGVAQQAAERSEVKPLRPVAMVNVAAIDRVLADVDYVFAAAGRPEFSDFVASLLANVRDFAGIDRKKPLGLMVFVDPSVDLKPIPVGYLPVEDMNELIKTFSAGTFTIKRAEKAGYYEVIGRRGILQMRQVGGYAFIAEEVETLQQDLPDPAGLTSSLTSNYDVAVMVDLRDVPDALRTVFAQGLRTSAEAELRQREKESDEQYRFRRASAESVLELLEMAIEDGQVLKVGFRASPQAHMAVLEADLQVKSDSDFSEYLQRIAGRRSQFEGLLNAEAPFTFSTSWSLGQQGRASLTELINMLERRISAELGGSPADKAPVTQLADVFRRTARDGHLDFFIQMRRYDPGLFVLVGGMKVTDGQKTAQALAQILQKINDRSELAELQLNALSYKGVTVHRVRGQRVSRRDQRLYGEKPSLYVGGGGQTLWFAVGGTNAVPALRAAIDQAQQGSRKTASGSGTPFRLTVNMTDWVQNADPERPFGRIGRQAFQPDADALRVELQPTDDGARLRVEFEEGFLKLIGLLLTQRLEQRLQF